MKISSIDIRLCRHDQPLMKDAEMRDGKKSDLEFIVITFETDEGLSSSTFGFAGRGALMAGEIANSIFKPFFLGRDPLYREKHWHEYRMADRWWNHAPIYSYGPFDINCWLLSAIKADQPLYKYLGAYRDSVPIYASSLVLSKPEDYAKEALDYKKLTRLKLNCYPNQNKKILHPLHKDAYEHNTKDYVIGVYHFNTCNGETIVNDEKIKSEENQMLLFDNIPHQGNVQTDTRTRVVLNFNFKR